MRNRPSYQAFLLKLWPIASQGRVAWRAILENPYTGERHGFKDLEELFHFLKALTGEDAQPTGDKGQNGKSERTS